MIDRKTDVAETDVVDTIAQLSARLKRLEALGSDCIEALRICLANPLLSPAQRAAAEAAVELMFDEQPRWLGPARVVQRPDKRHGARHIADCPPSAIEVRRTPNGLLDEIVAEGASIHLEQMDDNAWWMAIEKDGMRQVVWLTARGRISANSERDQ